LVLAGAVGAAVGAASSACLTRPSTLPALTLDVRAAPPIP